MIDKEMKDKKRRKRDERERRQKDKEGEGGAGFIFAFVAQTWRGCDHHNLGGVDTQQHLFGRP